MALLEFNELSLLMDIDKLEEQVKRDEMFGVGPDGMDRRRAAERAVALSNLKAKLVDLVRRQASQLCGIAFQGGISVFAVDCGHRSKAYGMTFQADILAGTGEERQIMEKMAHAREIQRGNHEILPKIGKHLEGK